MSDFRLITLDPGHFHAALVQKQMLPGVARQSHVYAPLGPDLIAHVQRIAGFNSRTDRPTGWELEVHAGPDYLERMLRERPGDIVILSGRNERKLDYILSAVDAGLHVLADKPWIIAAGQHARLHQALDLADARKAVALDIMTERHEITSILQRELVHDPEIFGDPKPGTAESPGVFMESMHYLIKDVAGVPLQRPARFFDIRLQGDGLADVGTHLVDLVSWILGPEQSLDYRTDVQILSRQRWPTALSLQDFERVTGETDFPNFLRDSVANGQLEYPCNNRVEYTLRGVLVRLDVLWNLETPPGGGDTHLAVFRGSRSRIEVRQGPQQGFKAELYVVPNRPAERADILSALKSRIAACQERYPGLAIAEAGVVLAVTIPQVYRTGHEAHFAAVAQQFFRYVRGSEPAPAWEKPAMLAKYYVTTHGPVGP